MTTSAEEMTWLQSRESLKPPVENIEIEEGGVKINIG